MVCAGGYYDISNGLPIVSGGTQGKTFSLLAKENVFATLTLKKTRRALAQLSLGRSSVRDYCEVRRGLYDHLDGSSWVTVRRYSAQIADEDAQYRASARCGAIKLGCNYDYAKEVSERIRQGESPDSIVGTLRREGKWTVSTSTLYRYIAAGYIPHVTSENLREKPKHKRIYHKTRAKRAPAGQSIEKRPEEIQKRSTFGHWELDCVIGKSEGKKEALLVLTERMTRYEMIFKLNAKTSEGVNRTLGCVLSKFPLGTFRSITVDNGSEFSQDHALPVPVYYCHPYCSAERGSNENCNRLIRRYFPKGRSMTRRTQRDADAAAEAINRMHRKILGYRTAQECFSNLRSFLHNLPLRLSIKSLKIFVQIDLTICIFVPLGQVYPFQAPSLEKTKRDV